MSHVAILGAGIAGISAGWFLKQKGIDFTIIEKQSYVGGLARSFPWHGFNCDFAAHRLFTYNEEVLQQLLNLVPMGRHIRRSKLYLNGHWMNDPLNVLELLYRLPALESAKVVATYMGRPRNLEELNFKNFVIKRYGAKLYQYFFQPYTEKLFGIPGDEISVLWARQKVRLANPLDNLRENTKTKFQYFYYPIQGGYGSITNSMYSGLMDRVILNAQVTKIETDGDQVNKVRYVSDGVERELQADAVISTLPMSLTSWLMGQSLPLEFQKVDAVYLWVNKPSVSDYHWIYFGDASVAINRMVEFKNMSSTDTDPKTTVLCAEVTQEHADPAQKVADDLVRAGLIQPGDVLDSKVIREKFAYPVYNQDYEKVLASAEEFFSQYKNLFLVGRSAEFRHREVDDNFEAASDAVEAISRMFAVPETMIEEVKMTSAEKTYPPVYAVILTFNHYEDTQECLQSVQNSSYPNLKIVVVDNGSSDGTPERIRAEFPQVHTIVNEQNLGVPAGYNIGFRYALDQKAEYILMLNNDTVVDAEMTGELVRAAEKDPASGVIMPRILYYGSKDDVWSSGGRYRAFPPAILFQDKDISRSREIRMIEYAPSCGLLIHRRAFEKAGLFDPGYFYLFDDWDFSERVRAHGLRIYSHPDARMWHKVSKTIKDSRRSFYWKTFGESITRFYRRHGRPVWFSLPVHVSYIFLRDMVFHRNWMYSSDFIEGVKTGLQKPMSPFPTVSN